MASKFLDEKLPPSYTNLGYDADIGAGPSAPANEDGFSGSEVKTIPVPTTPPPVYETGPSMGPGFFGEVPTAPTARESMDTLNYNVPTLVFEDIYEACLQYANDHCCYSTRFVRQMKLLGIDNNCAFHYTLESFGEKRESATQTTPYKGGSIDGPENGQPPSAWDMAIYPSALFVDAKSKVVIPHTESVHTCTRCGGTGKVVCSSCSGIGYDRCYSCSGTGRDREQQTCSSCSGRGRRTCSRCWGSGRVTCSRCDGYGKIKNYKVLIVTWTNHRTEFVSSIGQVPAKKFTKVEGETIFSEVKVKLSPIRNAPDDSVNRASASMLQAHQNSFSTEIFRKQRHSLRAVPFTVAKYKWKEEEGELYIYGKERKVYFEEYPTSCCCICC